MTQETTPQKWNPTLFRNPTSEYRSIPFWSWNNHLEKNELFRQIDIFKKMGFGGFQMHVRTGLKDPYLSKEFMELVRNCVDKASTENMFAWIYDEDQWPSGYGGGFVTKDMQYRQRRLYWTTDCPKEEIYGCYDVQLDDQGYLSEYHTIDPAESAVGTKWYASVRLDSPSPRFNDQTYVDTLNPEATRRFIAITHEQYKKTVGDQFGKVVPAIFTDEPNVSPRQTLAFSFDTTPLTLPWTDKVPAIYRQIYHQEIRDFLPELLWELPNHAYSVHRYRYHNLISDLFAHSFTQVIGEWCQTNHISFTGHMVDEDSLSGQSTTIGEAMRSYPYMDIPGIDILCGAHNFVTAKQAQSVVHQYGKEGMVAELYGVTGWEADFRDYKHQGDWLAALGTTVRVPHLAWYAMEGEAKRDYPASFSYQSSWYKEFPALEDHYARLNTVLTRGKPVVKIGVIHPIESFWLYRGPGDLCHSKRQQADEEFLTTARWLLESNLDFDYISEALLPKLCPEASSPLKVGVMEYDAILVPNCKTLRRTTLDRLQQFQSAGGKLIFMGEAPELVDALPSEEGRLLCHRSLHIPFSKNALISALDSERSVWLWNQDGTPANNYLYQLRKDGEAFWLYIAPSSEPFNKDTDSGKSLKIVLPKEFILQRYDTVSGDITDCPCEYRNGQTILSEYLYGYDTLLYYLSSGKSEGSLSAEKPFTLTGTAKAEWGNTVDYKMEEQNVLLLDIAEYKLDDAADFSPSEELLRIDERCRTQLGMRSKSGYQVQPWAIPPSVVAHRVTLKFTIESDIALPAPSLALENPETKQILLNGQPVIPSVSGYYIDISLKTILLPPLTEGKNILEVTLPFGEQAGIENLYLLGDFGVRVQGRQAHIIEKPKKISFGDLTTQGFPFYGGAITYDLPIDVTEKGLSLTASYYRGALITAAVDGIDSGRIIYPPYTLTLPDIPAGRHILSLTLYPHRYNTFGSVHLSDEKKTWFGPAAWRTQGTAWSYEYVLRKIGILKSPEIQ